MLWTLLMLAPLSQGTADAVLDRFKAAIQKPFSVSYELTRGDVSGPGAGSVTLVRPLRMNYKVKWGTADYEFYTSENRAVEIIRSRKAYYEMGPFDKLYQPSSNFTALAEDAFPLILMLGDPRTLFGPIPRKLVGSEVVNGVTCDHVHGGNDNGGYDVFIDAEGKLIRIRYDIVGRSGKTTVKFDFKDYTFGKDYPLSLFEPEIPAGFNPSAFTKATWPLAEGSVFPREGWLNAKGQSSTLNLTKPVLAVVTDSECEPSARAAGAITKLAKTVPVWLFSADGKVPKSLSAFAAYRDRGGRTMDRFFAPGTPLFLLVGANGRIKRIWYGFDPELESAFIKEVRAALADK